MVELIDATRDDFDWDTLDAPKKTTTDLTNGSCSIYFGSTRSSSQTAVTSRGSFRTCTHICPTKNMLEEQPCNHVTYNKMTVDYLFNSVLLIERFFYIV